MIYLDNNATTQPATEVFSIISKCLKENFGNPSSGHPFGSKAREAVDRARTETADLIGAGSDEIIFTSGGTEANNMAIIGTALKHRSGHIISSAIEHPSVMNPLRHLKTLGYNVTYIPADKYGMVDPADVIKKIRKNTILITIMHSNNETGTIQPISRIGEIARRKGIPFHCDAAQSVGKMPVNVKRLNTDMLTIVSHKFYGPKGVGALYLKSGTEITSIAFGASHERGIRPGTENVCSIAGLGRACVLAKKERKTRVIHMKRLSRLFYTELKRQVPGLKLNGHPSKRLPNTLNLSFPNVISYALLEKTKNDIAASTGSACHEGMHTASHVLKAMGLSDKDAFSAVRLSLGRTTTEAQVRKAVKAIVKAYRGMSL